jgi:HK97 family phage portal protein
MTYRVMGGRAGYKAITLTDFDNWLDTQISGGGDATEAYKAVAWAYRCVQLRANAVSTMPFVVTREGSEDEVDSPWPLTRLLWTTEAALCTWGAFYWLKRSNRVLLKELQWLNPLTMRAEYNVDGIQYFEQKVGTETRRFTPEQIVYGRLWNPSDDLGPGVAPLQVALEAAGIAKNINAWATGFFEHGAIPTVLLHTDSTLPRGEAERIEGAWNRMVSGLRNAWKAVVLQGGMKPEIITPPVNTLALPELQTGVRAQIATAMGIPQTMLEDAANFATAKEHKQSFILDTIAPECELIQEAANEQLFKQYGLELEFRPQELDLLQEDEAARAASLQQLTGAGLPLRLAMEVLGYDLSDEQWAQLEQAEADKLAKQERDFELQKERLAQPVIAPQQPPQAGARPTESEDERGERSERAMRSALRLWEKKAVKRLKERGSAVCLFESEHIPAGVAQDISIALSKCTDALQVKALFDVYEGDGSEFAPAPATDELEAEQTERLHETRLRGLEDNLTAKLREHFQDIARRVAETATLEQ